ncbi:hypothetical protein HBI56_099010 [Parastagonospora nodorum]|nr:hypothetical protein HBI10_025050 [Parastagonospora nodorum]KAH4022968.1 hypothetical protein HBI13_092660 [Parastagonospora nodorum]KAH4212511.1 hypothetical protein HBI95_038340 [Parastagonospora nodorum]KAH5077555.1 hypothetical protein HBH95_107550 [Parastagonospora nodorum]KAH5167533.1 hypothetical protein HBI73_015750 [Parastagonospora nodorum]
MNKNHWPELHPQLFAAALPRRTAPLQSHVKTTHLSPLNSPTMSQTPAQLRSLYRRILRELPIPASTTPSRTSHQKLSTPSTLQKRIRDTLAKPAANTDSRIQQAEQFAQYVQAQRTYLALIERYNPGMGMSEEERVRLSARRVGMNLPVEYEVGGKE